MGGKSVILFVFGWLCSLYFWKENTRTTTKVILKIPLLFSNGDLNEDNNNNNNIMVDKYYEWYITIFCIF